MIGEQGLTLSGGQRQRVALARALITDPAILVLDDATSAIDARVEAQIHETLRHVMAGRTTLLIAHRRSTLQLADKIAVLDDGRLVDLGTHEELTARCPLYRLLLAGPGDDAEGVDAGELAYYEPADGGAAEPAGRTAGTGTRRTGDGDHSRPVAARDHAAEARRRARPAGRRAAVQPGRHGHRARHGPRRPGAIGRAARGSDLAVPTADAGRGPPTPELLAKVAALPPANDEPGVDQALARAGDSHFTLRRLLRPFAIALIAGLILDGLDAIAGVAIPWLMRGGIDRGIGNKAFHAIVLISLAALAIVLADWVVNAVQTVVVGRNGERLLYTLRVKIFAQLQRLGLDFYEREMAGGS